MCMRCFADIFGASALLKLFRPKPKQYEPIWIERTGEWIPLPRWIKPCRGPACIMYTQNENQYCCMDCWDWAILLSTQWQYEHPT